MYEILGLLLLVAPMNALVCVCAVPQGNGQDSSSGSSHSALRMTLDELRQVNRYAESTKSLSYLPQVSGETPKHTYRKLSLWKFVLSFVLQNLCIYTNYSLPTAFFCIYSLVSVLAWQAVML